MERPPTETAIRAACMMCREGNTLSEICQVVGHSEEQVLWMLGQATGILPEDIGIILRMRHKGSTLQAISTGLKIDIEILTKFLADDLTDSTSSLSSAGLSTKSKKVRTTSKRGSDKHLGTEDLRQTAPARFITDTLPHAAPIESPVQLIQEIQQSIPVHPYVAPAPPVALKPGVALAAQRDLPIFIHRPNPRQENRQAVLEMLETDEGMYPVSSTIYSYSFSDNLLIITNLDTQLTSSVVIQGVSLYYGTCLTELPDGSLLTTGGAYGQVFSIEVPSFAVTRRASMHFNRTMHASVYHDRYVYVVGGNTSEKEPAVLLKECERYLISEDRWEDIPPIPEFCGFVTCLVMESDQSLYALGTPNSQHQGIIQKLCLASLNWTVLALQLPHEGGAIPVFKLSEGATKMYFVMESCLYSFNPFFQTIQLVKTLSTTKSNSFFGPSYYRGGILYCSNCTAAPFKFEIGQLS